MAQSQSASFAFDPQQVQQAAQWVENTSRGLGLADSNPLRLALIAEELFANSLHHADIKKDAEISFEIARDGDQIRLDYVEPGAIFNPLDVDVPEAPELDRWPIGGLGLRLIQRFSARCSYTRDPGANRLSIWVEKSGGEA
jgi:anti-sigma regulatory factor (Ser/Thr protein kinase)